MPYRLQLLQISARYGIRSLAYQTFLVMRDLFALKFRGPRRALIYAREAMAENMNPTWSLPHVKVLTYYDEKSIPSTITKEIKTNQGLLGWNLEDGFHLGWQLWVVCIKGQFAGGSWMVLGSDSCDFMMQTDSEEAVIRQTSVLPGFRGRGIQRLLYQHMSGNLTKKDLRRIYISCWDYNIPSRRNIERCGFQPLGIGLIGPGENRHWYPFDSSKTYKLQPGTIVVAAPGRYMTRL